MKPKASASQDTFKVFDTWACALHTQTRMLSAPRLSPPAMELLDDFSIDQFDFEFSEADIESMFTSLDNELDCMADIPDCFGSMGSFMPGSFVLPAPVASAPVVLSVSVPAPAPVVLSVPVSAPAPVVLSVPVSAPAPVVLSVPAPLPVVPARVIIVLDDDDDDDAPVVLAKPRRKRRTTSTRSTAQSSTQSSGTPKLLKPARSKTTSSRKSSSKRKRHNDEDEEEYTPGSVVTARCFLKRHVYIDHDAPVITLSDYDTESEFEY